MLQIKRLLVLAVVLGITATAVSAQSVALGVRAGFFLPQSSEARDNFGSTWTSFSISPMNFQRPDSWSPTFNFASYNNSDNGGSASLIPLTLGVIKALSRSDSTTTYVAIRAGGYYGDVSNPGAGIGDNGFGLTANASYGVIFNNRFFLEARYDWFEEMAGVNFSGIALTAGVQLFEFRL